MSTKFFSKKRESVAFGLAVCSFLLLLGYALSLCFVKRVEVQASVYFLTTEDTRVEAGAEFAKLEGGAGYLLSEGGKEYVALSVYATQEEGLAVQQNLLAEGRKTELVSKGVDSLCFRGKEKKKSDLYVNALRSFREYMSVLSGCISRLEKGSTQERCKELLGILERQFGYARNAYAKYGAFAEVCAKSQGELQRLGTGTVYLKDLRYLLCWQAEQYVELASAFV